MSAPGLAPGDGRNKKNRPTPKHETDDSTRSAVPLKLQPNRNGAVPRRLNAANGLPCQQTTRGVKFGLSVSLRPFSIRALSVRDGRGLTASRSSFFICVPDYSSTVFDPLQGGSARNSPAVPETANKRGHHWSLPCAQRPFPHHRYRREGVYSAAPAAERPPGSQGSLRAVCLFIQRSDQ